MLDLLRIYSSADLSCDLNRKKKAEQNGGLRNVHNEGGKALTPATSKAVLLSLSSVSVRGGSAVSELQEEVICLFDELRDRLLRYAISFGLSGEDGEEIVQEAFLALFQHLQQDRCRRNLRGWLFRVTHNLALKRLSGNERRRDTADLGTSGSEAHSDLAPSPEEQLAFSQRQRRLLAVLRALPAQDQRCLSLRAEGLRHREIAEVVGMSLGSVSASLARSLARLGRADGR
jgi:RNA polymerase sigma-70 factor (ECF subfamily)